MENPISIYPAAALFNGRETLFNSQLVEGLEEKGYKTNFPQRDGFEFGNLHKALFGKLPSEQVNSAVQNVIYFLDMGILLPKSDVVLANLDEPLDEGLVVEISYAKLMDKFIIGFRTDVRSPYGSITDSFGGMHFFPALQCNKFFLHYMPCKTPAERKSQMKSLVSKIDETIKKEEDVEHKRALPSYVAGNPHLSAIFQGADLLFQNIEEIHSEKGLNEIASRYIRHRKDLEKIGPEII